ncbi:MAG: carbon-nitrogen hydrolase family protein [Paracoccaceae bacterium]|nr:carbon-nitrogen hydrolase family protein [Paracoccaceae bacterium]
MRAALIQITSTDDPAENLEMVRARIAEAAEAGADWVLTPEVTNCVSSSRTHQKSVLRHETDDPMLAELRAEAERHGVAVLIGSLALLADRSGEAPLVNRSFLIGPDGVIRARYDKIHMFDVEISEAETYRESAAFQPGDRAVVADVGSAVVGLSVCYDVRFPALYRRLAAAGATVLTVPAAFSPVSGEAHWETLLRARAIETGSYVLAPAQCGRHATRAGRPRASYGHSLAVDPWGKVLVDGGTEPGIHLVDIEVDLVTETRRRIPSLFHGRPFEGP